MLEIILIVVLSRRIGEIVSEKGYKKGKYVGIFILLWVVGELGGAFTTALFLEGMWYYFGGIVGAATAAVLWFRYVNGLEPIEKVEAQIAQIGVPEED